MGAFFFLYKDKMAKDVQKMQSGGFIFFFFLNAILFSHENILETR